MVSTNQSGLAKVQSLYVVQVELVDCVAQGLRTPAQVQKAKKHLQEFSRLLKDADWSYMGGEDVYVALQRIQKDMSAKIKKTKGTKSAPKKVVTKKAKKVTAKKKISKKKATKKK